MNKNKYLYIFFSILLLCSIYILSKKNTSKEDYIMEDTKYESPIYFVNNRKRKKVLIIGGIHGNEIAGIKAAEIILEDKPNWANFIIIPKANTEAIKLNKRNPYYMSDLNRAFPGKLNGTDTEVLAFEIFKIIEKEKPHIIFDLHEWEKKYDEDSNYDANGLILNSFNSSLWEIVEKVYNDYKTSGSTKVMLNISPLDGSLNKEISERLDIPVLTVESNMNDELEDRIKFHLYVIENVIKNYEMDD